MLGAQGAGRDLYRVTLAVTRDLGFSGLIRRTALIKQVEGEDYSLKALENPRLATLFEL
jgi:hypothetical protein